MQKGVERNVVSLVIRYTSSYGEMYVTINGAEYIYYLDAGHIPKVEKMAKHQSGKALAFLKKVASSYERRTYNE